MMLMFSFSLPRVVALKFLCLREKQEVFQVYIRQHVTDSWLYYNNPKPLDGGQGVVKKLFCTEVHQHRED